MWIRCFAALAVAAAVLFGSAERHGGVVRRARGQEAAESTSTAAGEKKKIVRIHKTGAQWRRQLTRKQFEVTRLRETETAYTGRYLRYKRVGTYRCVCCGLDLFDSKAKYDSRTGWPAFWRPIAGEHVTLGLDDRELPVRTEVTCTRCGAHLGHVFGDGPPPSGVRYCVNSAALKFVAEAKERAATRRTTEPPAPADQPSGGNSRE